MDTPDFEAHSTGAGDLEELLRRVANAPPLSPPMLPVSGERWGRRRRYRIEHCLGKGGMGAVYLAYDLLLDRPVALKVLHRTSEMAAPDDRGRLLHEARAAALVEHDRSARVYDVGEHDGVPFVSMEYIRGVTLRRWMTGRVGELVEILTIAVQIAEGLDALHRSGIVHRDLKPENVMLPESGGIKLLDLGLAKRSVTREKEGDAGERPSVGLRVGTPGYMAPEQYVGSVVDARADIFALGVLLFELITKQRPFDGASLFDLTRSTLHDPPLFTSERWRTIPPPLRAVVEQALAKDPANRLSDARSILDALVPLLPPGSTRLSSNPLSATIDLEHATTLAAPSGGSILFGKKGAFGRFNRLKRVGRRYPLRTLAVLAVVVLCAPFVTRAKGGNDAADLAWVPNNMIGIRAGTLNMGRTHAEIEAECARLSGPCEMPLMAIETPPAEAHIDAFAIDRDEVVVDDFAVMLNTIRPQTQVDPDDDGSLRFVRFKSGLHKGELVADLWHSEAGIRYVDDEYRVTQGAGRLPMRLVTWLGANLFCRYRAARLPREAEWEFAARGTTNRRFPWGDDAPSCAGVALQRGGIVPVEARGVCPEPLTGPVTVGTSPQDVTPEGVRDLGGNLSEWTDTTLLKIARAAVAPLSSADGSPGDVDDPMTVRGGSYHESFLARTTARTRLPRGTATEDAGFRCAVSAP